MNFDDSYALRQLVSKTDVDRTTIPVVIDKPRTLKIKVKQYNDREHMLVVSCIDEEDDSIVILHLPFEEGARASAYLIQSTES